MAHGVRSGLRFALGESHALTFKHHRAISNGKSCATPGRYHLNAPHSRPGSSPQDLRPKNSDPWPKKAASSVTEVAKLVFEPKQSSSAGSSTKKMSSASRSAWPSTIQPFLIRLANKNLAPGNEFVDHVFNPPNHIPGDTVRVVAKFGQVVPTPRHRTTRL